MSLSYGDESTIRAYNGMGCMMIAVAGGPGRAGGCGRTGRAHAQTNNQNNDMIYFNPYIIHLSTNFYNGSDP